jgi:ferritin-like protein
VSERSDATRPATRRQLLIGASLVGSIAALVGQAAPAWAALSSPSILAMQAAVRLEQTLAVAYGSLSARRTLDAETRDLFALLADHEHQHAAALLALAEYLGGAPPPVPTLAQTELALPGISGVRDRASALTFAEGVENAELYGFYTTEQTLQDIKLVELSAAVMCGDAQHLVLIAQARGEDPIPSAFVSGSQTG